MAALAGWGLFSRRRSVWAWFWSLASRKRDIAAAAFLVVLSLAYRIPFLAHPFILFDSDQAILGFVARDIARGRPAPVFHYGQAYLGTLTAHIAAFFLGADGITPVALQVVAWAIYAAFLVVFYAMLRTVVTMPAALLAGVYLAASPVSLTATSLNCANGLPETFMLTTLGALIAFRLFARGDEAEAHQLVLVGFLFGFAVYIRTLAVYALVAVGVGLLLRPRRVMRLHGWLLVAAGLFIGYLPAILYDAAGGGHAWTVAERAFGIGTAQGAGVWHSLWQVATCGIPALLGTRFPSDIASACPTEESISPMLSVCAGALLAAGYGFLLVRSFRGPAGGRAEPGRGVLWFFAALLGVPLLMVGFSGKGNLALTWRYLHPAYPAVGFVFGLGVWALYRRSRAIAVSLIVLVLALNAASSWLFAYEAKVRDAKYRAFVSLVSRLGVRHLYTDYWCALLTSFVTDRRIICSIEAGPFRSDRLPWLTRQVDRARTAALAPRSSSIVSRLRGYLEGHRIAYDYREAFYPLFFNLGRKVRPSDLDAYPMVAVCLRSPHNALVAKRSYRQDDQIIARVFVATMSEPAQFDLLMALRDEDGRLFWLPDCSARPTYRRHFELGPGEYRCLVFRANVREIAAFAGLKRRRRFELFAALAQPGTVDFDNRIHSVSFTVKPASQR